MSRRLEEVDLSDLPQPCCAFCGGHIEQEGQDCPALDEGVHLVTTPPAVVSLAESVPTATEVSTEPVDESPAVEPPEDFGDSTNITFACGSVCARTTLNPRTLLRALFLTRFLTTMST